MEVQCIWGPTGTGKSLKAFTENKKAYWFPRPQNSACYALNLAEETTCIFDDFYGWLPYDLLLRITDRYPLALNMWV